MEGSFGGEYFDFKVVFLETNICGFERSLDSVLHFAYASLRTTLGMTKKFIKLLSNLKKPMKYKIIITVVLCLFVTGCTLKKPTETKPDYAQIENGTVFLINTDGNKIIIATSKPEDGTIEGHFSQYTYTKATLSPNKKFVAFSGDGWETEYVRVYDIQTKRIHDLRGENLYPLDYTWTESNLLTGIACPSQDMNLCSGQKTFISLDSLTPWLISEK